MWWPTVLLLASAVTIGHGARAFFDYDFDEDNSNWMKRFLSQRDICPPFGDHVYNVRIWGKGDTPSGCTFKYHKKAKNGFQLWVARPQHSGQLCGNKSNFMEHYNFDCAGRWRAEINELKKGWHYISFYELDGAKYNRSTYRCSVIETRNNKTITMYITKDGSCNGLISYLIEPDMPYVIEQKKRGDWNGTLVVNFTPGPVGSQAFSPNANDKPVEKKRVPAKEDRKRVARQTPEGCRFPDWAQGKWMNLNVEDGSAYYPYVIRENDDTDDEGDSYEVTGDDGRDGDAESVDHYIERSKRNAPIQVPNNEQTQTNRPLEIFTHPTELTSTSSWPKFVTTEIPITTHKYPKCACARRGRRSAIWNANLQNSKLEDTPSYIKRPIQTTTKDPLAKFNEYWNLFPTTTTTEGVPTTINYVTLWPKFLIRRGRRSAPFNKVEDYWNQYPTNTATPKYSISDTTNNLNIKFHQRSKRSTHLAQNKENLKSDDPFFTTQETGPRTTTTTHVPLVNDAFSSTLMDSHRGRFPDRNLQEPSNEPLSEAPQSNNPAINVKHVKNKRAAKPGLSPFSLFLTNEMNNKVVDPNRKFCLWKTIKSMIFGPSEDSPNTPVPTPETTPSTTTSTTETVTQTMSPEEFKDFMKKLPSKSMDIIKTIQYETDPVRVDHLYGHIKNYDDTHGYLFNDDYVDGNIRIRRCLWSMDTTVTLPPRSPPGVPEYMLVRPNQTLDVTDKLEHKNVPLDTDKIQIGNPVKRTKRDIPLSVDTEIPLQETTALSKSSKIAELQQKIKDKIIYNYLLHTFYHMIHAFKGRAMMMDGQNIRNDLEMRNKRSVDENKEETTTMLAGENVKNKRNKRCFWSSATTVATPQSSPHISDLIPIRPIETLDVIDKYDEDHDPLNKDNVENVRKSRDIPTKRIKRNIPPRVNTEISVPQTTTQSKEEKLATLKIQLKDSILFNYLMYRLYHVLGSDRRPSVTMVSKNTEKEFATRNKRSADDYDTETTTVDELEDEEIVLEKTRIAEQKKSESFMKWWNEFQPRAVIEYENRKHWREQLNNKDYDNYPERKPLPSPIEYLKSCKADGIPYKDALIKWRQKERVYRMWRAEVEYTAYPGRNRPEVVMEDFDLTYKDIIYDFDPQHPEGTADDPTAYLVQTLSNGSRVPARKSRHDVWQEKQARMFPSSAEKTQEQLLENEVLRSIASRTTTNNRKRRNSDQRTTSKVAWRCMMPVDADLNDPLTLPENGVKYLTVGGRVIEDKTELYESLSSEEKESDRIVDMQDPITYGCLWIVPRGPNVLEFSILGTGTPGKGEDLVTFGKQLCAENKAMGRDGETRNRKKLRPRRQSWVTETRSDEKNRVPVACPVPTGTVFYGVIPAPPPQAVQGASGLPFAGGPRSAPSQLCAKLISSTDVCTDGQPGPFDQMKYTVSECVDQNPAAVGKLSKSPVFEEREYQCLGQWSEVQPQTSPLTGENPVTFTYTYVKRVDPTGTSGAEYECFVGTTIPNDAGRSTDTTTTLLLTEAGTGTRCSRLADPYQSGMKLVGTKTTIEGSCAGPAHANPSGGSWYPLKPQQVPSADGANGGWKWMQNPGGQLPAGNGGTSRQNQGQQTGRPPTEANGGARDFGRGTQLMIATYAIAMAIVAERIFA